MSRLIGLVDPTKDSATQYPDYWIWRADSIPGMIPPGPEWDFERLTIERRMHPEGNVFFRISGRPHDAVPSGVFLELFVNPARNPEFKTDEKDEPIVLDDTLIRSSSVAA